MNRHHDKAFQEGREKDMKTAIRGHVKRWGIVNPLKIGDFSDKMNVRVANSSFFVYIGSLYAAHSLAVAETKAQRICIPRLYWPLFFSFVQFKFPMPCLAGAEVAAALRRIAAVLLH